MTIGDTEPEDAYDASDPVALRLANVIRRLRLLDAALEGNHKARLWLVLQDLETIRNEV